MVYTRQKRAIKPCLIGIFVLFFFVQLPKWFTSLLSGASGIVKKDQNSVQPIDIQYTFRRPLVNAPPPSPLDKHQYRLDGLLEVNENGPHPIYELIARAEKEWEAKLSKASKTFQEAVKEYKKRYNRLPPKGFDLWWKYVTEHNVQLPDEYDTIYEDLEPFWGLKPSDLIKIHDESELKVDSYTVGKNNTNPNIDVLTYSFQEGRYNQLIAGSKEIIKMFRQIQDDLPDFRMTISPHDGPNRLSDYRVKRAVLDAAASGTYIELADLPKLTTYGWVQACSPKSAARNRRITSLEEPPVRPKKTFIYDHVKSMDPCDHPYIFYRHGQFLSHNLGPWPQKAVVPEFSYCASKLHHDIRFPVPYGWVEDIYPRGDDPEFDEKRDERLLWRGSNTGIFHSSTSLWDNSHRDFLVSFANDLEGTLHVLPHNRAKNEKMGKAKEYKKANVNPALMDITFAGSPISCSPPICELLSKIYPWRKTQTIQEAGSYKYVIDVDGNGWSGRFKRLMTTNSLIFKATIYPEWFANRIQPWVHYVPIQVDLSDLHDTLFFFRGDCNGEGGHEDFARKIAVTGRQWSKSFWRKEDVIAYLFRVTLEYARLMSLDRDAMTYHEVMDW